MKKPLPPLGKGILLFLAAALLLPLFIPYIPPKGVSSLENAMQPDSRTVEINGVNLHYIESGEGDTLILLLHGFGASTFSWRAVIEPLTAFGQVVAYDRPAFGLTERPLPRNYMWTPGNPYDEQANIDYVIGLIDYFGAEKAVLIGNSAGGRVALATAVAYPERVQALVLVDSVGGAGSRSSLFNVLLKLPQVRAIGPYAVRGISSSGVDTIYRAWYDPSLVTEEIVEGYKLPLQVENWDRALFEFTAAGSRPDLVEDFDRLTMPVLVLSGDDDRIVPVETAIELAGQIEGSELVIFENCGHVPQEECPAAFMENVGAFLAGMQ
ncbi:MAG: alpha/beta hydrolase [Anaerolineae bacterium]|jgi:pimeloyl-ACP methyl ester carboxylesterase|nr:alpha/beta hydrolase [Anaerolineae bacterium]